MWLVCVFLLLQMIMYHRAFLTFPYFVFVFSHVSPLFPSSMIYLLSHYTLVGTVMCFLFLSYVSFIFIGWIFVEDTEEYKGDYNIYYKEYTPDFIQELHSTISQLNEIRKALFDTSKRPGFRNQIDLFTLVACACLSLSFDDSKFLIPMVAITIAYGYAINLDGKCSIMLISVVRFMRIFASIVTLWATIIILNDHSTIIGTILSHFNTIK
jgi:hypothetical protein